jgi:hypothetical protein
VGKSRQQHGFVFVFYGPRSKNGFTLLKSYEEGGREGKGKERRGGERIEEGEGTREEGMEIEGKGRGRKKKM